MEKGELLKLISELEEKCKTLSKVMKGMKFSGDIIDRLVNCFWNVTSSFIDCLRRLRFSSRLLFSNIIVDGQSYGIDLILSEPILVNGSKLLKKAFKHEMLFTLLEHSAIGVCLTDRLLRGLETRFSLWGLEVRLTRIDDYRSILYAIWFEPLIDEEEEDEDENARRRRSVSEWVKVLRERGASREEIANVITVEAERASILINNTQSPSELYKKLLILPDILEMLFKVLRAVLEAELENRLDPLYDKFSRIVSFLESLGS